MTEEEIREQAWREVLIGAESYATDWIDEEGEYSKEDAKAIRAQQFVIIKELERNHR